MVPIDLIRIRGLRVDTYIGVTPEERTRPQSVVIDADVRADLSAPGRSDDLAHTIDYARLVERVAAAVRSSEAHLLEYLAEEIAAVISADVGVTGVAVEVGKASPPLAEAVERVSVRIERGRL